MPCRFAAIMESVTGLVFSKMDFDYRSLQTPMSRLFRCSPSFMILVESTNVLTLIMAYEVRILPRNSAAGFSNFPTMNSISFIVPVKAIHMSGLILTSRFRRAGTRIGWTSGALGSRPLRVDFARTSQNPKR